MPQARDAFEEVKKAYQVGFESTCFFPLVYNKSSLARLFMKRTFCLSRFRKVPWGDHADGCCGLSSTTPLRAFVSFESSSAVSNLAVLRCDSTPPVLVLMLFSCQILLDENKRITMAATIDAVCTRVSKERQRKIDKGMSPADVAKELGSEEAHKKKACMKEVMTCETSLGRPERAC